MMSCFPFWSAGVRAALVLLRGTVDYPAGRPSGGAGGVWGLGGCSVLTERPKFIRGARTLINV